MVAEIKIRPVMLGSILIGSFLVGGAIIIDENGIFGSITAAWVQAIGSIAAVVAAGVLAGSETRRSERAEFKRNIARLMIIEHVSMRCLRAMELTENVMAGRGSVKMEEFDQVVWETLTAALNEISLIDLPTADLAIAVVTQRQVCDAFRSQYRSYCEIFGRLHAGESEPEIKSTRGIDHKRAQLKKLSIIRNDLEWKHISARAHHGNIASAVKDFAAQRRV